MEFRVPDTVVYMRVGAASAEDQRFLWCYSGEWRIASTLRLSGRPLLRHDKETLDGIPDRGWKRPTENAGALLRGVML